MQCIVTYATGIQYILSYLKSVLRYKFLIWGTYHPDTLYLREQKCEDPWLLFETKRGPREKKKFGKNCIGRIFVKYDAGDFCETLSRKSKFD